MRIDRKYQRDLLAFLQEDFPTYEKAPDHCQSLRDEDEDKYLANVLYLQDHGLLEAGASVRFDSAGTPLFAVGAFPRITSAGIDFMLDDGGLSAILNVTTVKIHEDSIKALVEYKVLASNLPMEDKQSVIEKLKLLPSEGAKRLLDKLLDKGVDALLQGASAEALLGML